MMNDVVRWARCRAVWVWLAFAAALVVSAACTDSTAPRVTKQVEDTILDTLDHAG